MMYGFSRAIYRELADEIVEGAPGNLRENRAAVLAACEATMDRLGHDRYHFAHPTRTLIRELRPYFPLAVQARMRTVVEHYVAAADRYVVEQMESGFDIAGNRLACRSITRKGEPCQRPPLAHNGYCPSHQHLDEDRLMEVEAASMAAAAAASGADAGAVREMVAA